VAFPPFLAKKEGFGAYITSEILRNRTLICRISTTAYQASSILDSRLYEHPASSIEHQVSACSTTHHNDYAECHHAQIKERESAGNDSSDNRKYLAFIADDTHDANYQGSKE